jgi:predicted DNA-binding transcriptional regulator AlpA
VLSAYGIFFTAQTSHYVIGNPLRAGRTFEALMMNETEYLTQQQAAERLKLSQSTLEKFRCTGTGPAYLKIGRRVTYLARDLDSWAESKRCNSTSEYCAA